MPYISPTELNRRQALSQALMQQPRDKATGALGGLAYMLRQYGAGRGGYLAGQQEQQNADLRRKEMGALLQSMSGNTAVDPSTFEHPDVQDLYAQQVMAQALKKKDEKPISVAPGSTLIDPETYQPVYTAPQKPTPNQPFNADGTPNAAYQEYAMGLKRAGKAETNIENKIETGEKFGEKLQQEMATSLVNTYDTLANTPDAIATLEQAKATIPQAGTFVGSGAEAKLAAVKFLNNNLGTDIAPDQVANAEVLRSALFRQIMDNLKKMDAQPSERQQQALQNALGKIGTDPAALSQIIDITINTLESRVKEHNRRVKEAQGKGVNFLYDISVSVPERKSDAPAAPPVDWSGWEILDGDQ